MKKSPTHLAAACAAVACLFVAVHGLAVAKIGGVPVRGDNCTPFNGLAVGFPIPGHDIPAGSIVNETVVLADGWKVAGWILTSRDGHRALVPYRPTGTEDAVNPGVPTMMNMSDGSKEAVRRAYAALQRSVAAHSAAPASYYLKSGLHDFTLGACFASPLPKGR